MDNSNACPECGAVWRDEDTCQDFFHQLLFWEVENPAYAVQVHHLMVLSYHLQHPSLYSPQGLEYARQLLVDFLEHGATPEQIRKRDRASVNSNKRKWKITGSGEAHGSYPRDDMRWTMTAADVVAGGVDNYCNNVHLWATSIHDTLAAD